MRIINSMTAKKDLDKPALHKPQNVIKERAVLWKNWCERKGIKIIPAHKLKNRETDSVYEVIGCEYDPDQLVKVYGDYDGTHYEKKEEF